MGVVACFGLVCCTEIRLKKQVLIDCKGFPSPQDSNVHHGCYTGHSAQQRTKHEFKTLSVMTSAFLTFVLSLQDTDRSSFLRSTCFVTKALRVLGSWEL